MFYRAWALNWLNYWKSVDEPFKTNASYFNAAVCWYISCAIMLYSPIFAIYACIGTCFLFIGLPIMLLTKKIKIKDCVGPIGTFLLFITWDINIDESFSNVVKTRVVRNDSKEAQAKRDAFYKKQGFSCARLFFNPKIDCIICSQPIQDDEMAISEGMCHH